VNREQPQRGRRRSTRRAERERHLTTETVEGTALALESVDNVKGGDGLALGVLSVGDSIANDALEEGLQDTTGLLVYHGRNTLDTTTTRETTDGGLGDTLDVVTQDLAVTLGSALAEALATLSTSSHVARGLVWMLFDKKVGANALMRLQKQ